MKNFCISHWQKILLLLSILFLLPFFILFFSSYGKIFEVDDKEIEFLRPAQNTVAIVFGAGVGKNSVSAVFADRLRVAKFLLESGKVQKILISGDNRKVNYNEPEQAKKFLMQLGVQEQNIVLDYAGRRTYDTCWRAKNIFEVEDAILVTQKFHLPRAIFTCSAMNISVIGVSASLQLYRDAAKNFFRESLAQQKAFYEVQLFFHQAEITGPVEKIF